MSIPFTIGPNSKAKAAGEAHPECHKRYRDRIDAANLVHFHALDQARRRCTAQIATATATYRTAHPEDAQAYATFDAAINAAEETRRETIAKANEEQRGEVDAARREYRHSPGWLGFY
ncbi:MAG TPA: hypothetical protein VIE65_20130 [Methylobacter sp.]